MKRGVTRTDIPAPRPELRVNAPCIGYPYTRRKCVTLYGGSSRGRQWTLPIGPRPASSRHRSEPSAAASLVPAIDRSRRAAVRSPRNARPIFWTLLLSAVTFFFFFTTTIYSGRKEERLKVAPSAARMSAKKQLIFETYI